MITSRNSEEPMNCKWFTHNLTIPCRIQLILDPRNKSTNKNMVLRGKTVLRWTEEPDPKIRIRTRSEDPDAQA